MQAVAAAWPTPFGPLIPGAMGWIAADGWCFGELALLFSMTRPIRAGRVVPYDGAIPGSVWLFIGFFLAGALRTSWKGGKALERGWKGL
jgi:hypothetical protein